MIIWKYDFYFLHPFTSRKSLYVWHNLIYVQVPDIRQQIYKLWNESNFTRAHKIDFNQ